ncbi:MAG: hypothetical protein QOE26_2761 [Verrucomicrobiota bacterium]|jgi:hypothetical protein
MATVNVDLFALWQHGRFVTSLTNPGPPTLPAIVAGDTWNINVFFVDDTNPMQIHRFAGSIVSARIRCAGNNHAYATAAASGEIPSTTTPVVTRVQAGSSTQVEKQRIDFPSIPSYSAFGGHSLYLGFSGAGSGGRGGGTSLEGISGAIPANADAFDFHNAIQAIVGYYKSNDGPYTWGDLQARYASAIRQVFVTGSIAAGLVVEFGDLFNGANWWNTGIHLLTVDDSTILYPYGWNISLPFTDSNFSDYLLSANAPAFLEVTLNGDVVAFIQLTGATGSSPPIFTNSPPAAFLNSSYDFLYSAAGYPAPTFGVTAGALPPGLSLTSAGRISGTPTVAGTFVGQITATNTAGSASQSFSIDVGGGSSFNAPVFTNGNPPGAGSTGSAYGFLYTAAGYPVPTFGLTAGVLPTGLTLSSAGYISGTPASAGTFDGQITATNTAGSATQAFSITIVAPGGGGIPANITQVLYDGDHSGAWPIGPIRKESPFKSSPGYYIYRQRYRGFHNVGALPLGSVCPEDSNAGLVEETERQDLGGADLVEWDRVWANVPSVPPEFEVFNYPAQFLFTVNNGAVQLQSYVLTRCARVERTFIDTTNPGGIGLAILPRVLYIINNVAYVTAGFGNVQNGQTVIAADDTLERWMGNIWIKTHRTIVI